LYDFCAKASKVRVSSVLWRKRHGDVESQKPNRKLAHEKERVPPVGGERPKGQRDLLERRALLQTRGGKGKIPSID